MTIPMAVVLLIGFGLSFLLLRYLRKRANPHLQLKKAEEELKEGKGTAAHSRFLRVVALVEGGKAKSIELNDLASQAHLAVAEIERARGSRQEAAEHYRKAKALGAMLPISAVFLMAECYAERNETSEDALDAYLTYLGSGPKTGSAAELVHTTVQSFCQVTEDMKSAQRKPLGELNRRVLAANPNLEWAHYFFGLASLLDGRASEAIGAFVQARRINPDRALTCYWLGVCHLQLPVPDLDAAISVVDQFLSFPHGDTKNRKREARVCLEISRRLIEAAGGFDVDRGNLNEHQLADLDRAVHYLEVAGGRQPEDALCQHDLGRLYRLKGTRDKAITAFRRALQLSSGEKQYAFDLGMECLESGRLLEAIEGFEQAIKICPTYGEAHSALGCIYFDQSDFEKTITHLQAALDSDNSNRRLIGLLVRSLYSQGHYRQVAEEIDRRQTDISSLVDDLEATYAAGRSYAMLDRFEEAVAWLERATSRPDATYSLGCAHANLKEFALAMACFDQLSETGDQWRAKAILQRGHLLLLEGDDKGAERDYRQILESDPNNVHALRGLGNVALMRGDFEQAVSQLSAASAIEPQNAELRFALGVAWERKGDLLAALGHYEYASRVSNEDSVFLRIGVIRCQLGEFANALKAFDSCVESSNKADALLFYRGLACAQLGHFEDGILEWTRLQQRHPENERLRLNLARARYALGAQHLTRGSSEAALEQWEQYLNLCSMDESVARDVGELYFWRALESLRAENADALKLASEALHVALGYDPENQAFRYYSALCETQAGANSDHCVTELQNLAEEKWQIPRVLYHIGWCMLQEGQVAAACQILQQVQTLPNPNGYRRYAMWALANARIEAGEFEVGAEILMSGLESVGGGLEAQQ